MAVNLSYAVVTLAAPTIHDVSVIGCSAEKGSMTGKRCRRTGYKKTPDANDTGIPTKSRDPSQPALAAWFRIRPIFSSPFGVRSPLTAGNDLTILIYARAKEKTRKKQAQGTRGKLFKPRMTRMKK